VIRGGGEIDPSWSVSIAKVSLVAAGSLQGKPGPGSELTIDLSKMLL
jgi:hypothetical protein